MKVKMKTKSLRPAIALAGMLALAKSACAIDIYPADYTILPPGTTLALAYAGYTPSNTFHLDGVGNIPGSSIDQTVGIARVLYYNQLFGMPVAYQAYLPFGKLTDAKVGGAPLQTNNGLGDLTLGFTAFLVNRPDPNYGTTVGLTSYVSLPTGRYDVGAANLGAGAVTFTPQIGLIQGLGHGFFFDGS